MQQLILILYISNKSLDLLVTVLLGIIFLKEKDILRKIISTIIVLIGIVLIYI